MKSFNIKDIEALSKVRYLGLHLILCLLIAFILLKNDNAKFVVHVKGVPIVH